MRRRIGLLRGRQLRKEVDAVSFWTHHTGCLLTPCIHTARKAASEMAVVEDPAPPANVEDDVATSSQLEDASGEFMSVDGVSEAELLTKKRGKKKKKNARDDIEALRKHGLSDIGETPAVTTLRTRLALPSRRRLHHAAKYAKRLQPIRQY